MTARFLPALLCLAALAAAAQTVTYKVRLKDGSILLTDRPPPDAQIIERIETKPGNVMPSTRPSTERKGTAAGEEGGTGNRQQAFDAADREVQAAERALADARNALERGREPQEGEVRGTKGGGARTTEGYEARIKSLEDAVAAAEARVRKAYEGRNALR